MRSLLPFLVMVGILLVAITLGGTVFGFIDLVAITLLLGVTAAGTLTTFSAREVGRGIASYTSAGEALSRKDALLGANLFSRMSIMASGAGLMGALFGQLEFLHMLDDPTKMGPAIAVTLLSVLYAVVVGELMLGSMASDCLSRGGLVGIVERPKTYSSVRSMVGLIVGLVAIGQVTVVLAHLPQ